MKGEILLLICLGLFFLCQNVDAQCRPCLGCGNGKCEIGEDCKSCPSDCGICPSCAFRCGNNICERALNETSCSCPQDCGPCCVDGVCREDRGENFGNCPNDCGVKIVVRVIDAETKAIIPAARVSCQLQPGNKITYSQDLTPENGDVTFAPAAPGVYLCTGEKSPVYESNTVEVTVFPITCPFVAEIPLQFRYATLGGTTYNIVTLETLPNVTVQCTSAALTTPIRFSGAMGQYFYNRIIPGNYTCVGKLQGFADGVGTPLALPGTHTVQDLYLRPLPGRIEGWVNDNKGNWLQNVQIVCFVKTNELLRNSTTTNVAGFYQILNFDQGLVTCSASLAGYTPQAKNGIVPRGDALVLNFTLSLLPAALNGFVRDSATGLIIQGAQVSCKGKGTTGASYGSPTDVTGGYLFNPIDPNDYDCSASKQGYSSATGGISLNPGDSKTLNFTLTPSPSTISGNVTDRFTGAAVPGASVTCTFTTASQAALTGSTTTAGAFGPFSFTINSAADSVTFSCSATATGFGAGQSIQYTISRGGSQFVPIQLVLLGINVTVLDTDTSAPVNAATVTCISTTNAPLTSATPATGFLQYLGLQAGTYSCTATKTGYTSDTRNVTLTTESGIVAVVLRIGIARFPIEGYIWVDDTSRDAELATISLVDVAGNTTSAPIQANLNNIAGHTSGWRFLVPLPGVYRFFVAGPTVFSRTTNPVNFTLENHRNAPNYPLRIVVTVTSSIITGTLSSTLGGFLPSASVAAVLGGNTFQGTYNNNTGVYEIANLAAGVYNVTISSNGFISKSISVNVTSLGLVLRDNNVQLSPPTTGSISGVVRDVIGNPISGASVVVSNVASGASQTATTSATGAYRFASVPIGDTLVTASFTGLRTGTRNLTVVAADTTNFDFTLAPKGGQVSGSVFSLKNGVNTLLTKVSTQVCVFPPNFATPAPQAPDACAKAVKSGTTDLVTGKYSIDNIPEGSYYLYVDASAAGAVLPYTTPTTVQIVEGSPKTVDLFMPAV